MTEVLLPTPAMPRVRATPSEIRSPSGRAKRVLLAAPRGYCAGVDRAVIAVEKALDHYGAPVYVRKQIVHNRHVVETLAQRGAVFVDDVDDVPRGARVVFSAHGVSPEVVDTAQDRELQTIDATCPLVSKVHREAVRFRKQGYHILMIGHAGHEEVEGTMGEAPGAVTLVQTPDEARTIELPDHERLVWISQTTLSVDETLATVEALRARFPYLADPPSDDICYATSNRQAAVKEIAAQSDLVLVVGSANSSNSVRLVEVAKDAGARAAHRIDYAHEMDEAWLHDAATVGITSGASVPDLLVHDLLELLAHYGFSQVDEVTTTVEHQSFALPRELRTARKTPSAQ